MLYKPSRLVRLLAVFLLVLGQAACAQDVDSGGKVDSALISEAVVVWSGWGGYSWPHRDDDRIRATFGARLAPELVTAVHQLEDDFFKSEAWRTDADLTAAGERAAAEFRDGHPEIAEQAVQALAWCYTYDWK